MKNYQVGSKIKELRAQLNMSQKSFGRKIGVTGKAVSAYENGKCNPPLKVLEKISNTYKVSLVHIEEAKKLTLETKIKEIRSYLDDMEKLLTESITL